MHIEKNQVVFHGQSVKASFNVRKFREGNSDGKNEEYKSSNAKDVKM